MLQVSRAHSLKGHVCCAGDLCKQARWMWYAVMRFQFSNAYRLLDNEVWSRPAEPSDVEVQACHPALICTYAARLPVGVCKHVQVFGWKIKMYCMFVPSSKLQCCEHIWSQVELQQGRSFIVHVFSLCCNSCYGSNGGCIGKSSEQLEA